MSSEPFVVFRRPVGQRPPKLFLAIDAGAAPLLCPLSQVPKLSQHALPVSAERVISGWHLAEGPQRPRTVAQRRNNDVAALIEKDQVVQANHQPLDAHGGY